MRIITVSREFGSGGRELGKRLADALGYDYYDREVLTAIAVKCDISEDYAEYMLTHDFSSGYAITMRNSFHTPELMHPATKIMRVQTDIIREIAKKGRDFVIVGRNADLLLSGYKPFNIFVTADIQSKLKRCRERAAEGENISDKDMLSNIKAIDKSRSKNRAMISDLPWGDRRAYHLIVNTSDMDLKALVSPVAAYAEAWFGNNT